MINIHKKPFYLLSVTIMSVIVWVLLFWECCICKIQKKQMLIMGYSNSTIPHVLKDFQWKKGTTSIIKDVK